MFNKCLILVKTQLINQFCINNFILEKDSKKLRSRYIMLAIFSLVGLLLMGYVASMTYVVGNFISPTLIPSLAITLTSVMTAFTTITKSNGILFGYKDYDLLMSLPISTGTVITSRFINLYLINTIINIGIMLPMSIIYFIFVPASFTTLFMWLIGMICAPLIPTTFAALLGSIIFYISSRFKYTKLISTLLSFGILIAIFILPIFIDNNISIQLDSLNSPEVISTIENSIFSFYPIAPLFSKSIITAKFMPILCFMLLSIGWYALFIILLSPKYKAINTALLPVKSKNKFIIRHLKSNSPLHALYSKELKRFFNSYIYLMNMGVGALLAILFAISCCLFGPETIVTYLNIPDITQQIFIIMPLILSGILSLSCTSCVSLSLEGKNLWIIQSSPIALKTLFLSKILANLTLTVPVSLISSMLLILSFKPTFVESLMYLFVPLIYALFTSVWGLFINTRFPKYDWESEVQVIKQSLSSMIGMLGGALFSFIPLFIILSSPSSYSSIIIVFSSITILIITFTLYISLCKIKKL
ncbi:MAG: hypothetical protein ACRCSG_01025 [Cellulosilyticaceae bacterium]